MNYKLTTPCDECPFLIGSGFAYSKLVAHASGEFGCHKACNIDEATGDFVPHERTPHCAGALIFLEKQNTPHQMMRIRERLGLYDRTALDMNAPVVASSTDCAQFPEDAVPLVGDIWEDLTPGRHRFVKIHRTVEGADTLFVFRVQQKNGEWFSPRHSRVSETTIARFNGRRGGFRLHFRDPNYSHRRPDSEIGCIQSLTDAKR